MKNYSTPLTSSSEQYLKKLNLTTFLPNDEVTDLYINRPGEIFIETLHGTERVLSEKLSFEVLKSLAIALCVANDLEFTKHCIHSVILPGGERGQIILPPVIEAGCIAFAIRKKSRDLRLNLTDWLKTGRLENVKNASALDDLSTAQNDIKDRVVLQDFEKELMRLTSASTPKALLQAMPLIVENKLNVVMVGATGSGKTTFSKILANMIAHHQRIITLEDTHELELPYHQNKLHLLYKEGVITAHDLLFACMRLKPDRILITEIRSGIAWDYLTALNTGHPGGITSVHANNSAVDVFNRVATLAKESETARNLDFNFLLNAAKATIDVILFFEKTYLKQVFYNPYLTHLAKRSLVGWDF